MIPLNHDLGDQTDHLLLLILLMNDDEQCDTDDQLELIVRLFTNVCITDLFESLPMMLELWWSQHHHRVLTTLSDELVGELFPLSFERFMNTEVACLSTLMIKYSPSIRSTVNNARIAISRMMTERCAALDPREIK